MFNIFSFEFRTELRYSNFAFSSCFLLKLYYRTIFPPDSGSGADPAAVSGSVEGGTLHVTGGSVTRVSLCQLLLIISNHRHEGVSQHPHRPGRRPDRQQLLGALLPRARDRPGR